MKVVFGLTLCLFLGHVAYMQIFHGGVLMDVAIERAWFQFGALVLYWFVEKKL